MRKTIALAFIALLLTSTVGCSMLNNPTPAVPSAIPGVPTQIQTEVAQTLTAVAANMPSTPTSVPPPTQPAANTPTAVPPQPTEIAPPTASVLPTPSGEANPPTVQLLAPPDGAQVTRSQNIAVIALAADDTGINRVEFYADNVLYSSQSTPNAPTTYQAGFTWSSVQAGPHTLVVIAFDESNNASAPAAATVTVVANTTAPQVTILAPPSPQNLSLGAQLTVQGVANDEAGISQLQLLVDTQIYSRALAPAPQGQNPFSANFVYAADTPGTHILTLRAIDLSGNDATSTPLTVNVADNTPPNVAVNYSRLNARVNEQVIVYTNAADAAGIQRVELWADGMLYNVYNSPNPPAQTSLALQQAWASNIPGNHTLYVRVVDANNLSTSTPATNIFVRQPSEPTPTLTPYFPTLTPYPTQTPPPVVPPPDCQLQEPSTNFRVELPNPVTIRWTCYAPGAITLMQVYYQYSGTMSTLATAQQGNSGIRESGAFDWTPAAPGVVEVFVVAYDRLGQRGESPHIPGVVEPQRPPTIAPPPTAAPEQGIAGRWRGDVDGGYFVIELEPRIGCSEESCAWGGSFEDHRGDEVVRGELNGQLSGISLTLNVSGAQPGDVTWNFEGDLTANGQQLVGQWSEARAGMPSLQRGSVAFLRE